MEEKIYKLPLSRLPSAVRDDIMMVGFLLLFAPLPFITAAQWGFPAMGTVARIISLSGLLTVIVRSLALAKGRKMIVRPDFKNLLWQIMSFPYIAAMCGLLVMTHGDVTSSSLFNIPPLAGISGSFYMWFAVCIMILFAGVILIREKKRIPDEPHYLPVTLRDAFMILYGVYLAPDPFVICGQWGYVAMAVTAAIISAALFIASMLRNRALLKKAVPVIIPGLPDLLWIISGVPYVLVMCGLLVMTHGSRPDCSLAGFPITWQAYMWTAGSIALITAFFMYFRLFRKQ